MIACSVNHSSSHHYLHVKKFLYTLGRGRYRLYNAEEDGEWIIDEKGARIAGEELEDGLEETDFQGINDAFSLEKDFHRFLLKRLDSIEDGLHLYESEGVTGNEFSTDVGRIDILAIDRNGDYVVIELKVGKSSDRVVGQILRYMGWVKQKLAGEKKVRGIIILDDISDRLQFSVSSVPNITLKRYELEFKFYDVDV